MGVARTFQNIRLFGKLSVLDNVKVGLHNEVTYSLVESVLHLGSYGKKERAMDEKVLDILKVFGLEGKADVLASNLPYGMNPNETGELMETIKLVREKYGVTILLIEHDMKLVTGICEYLYVLNFGKLLAEGTPKEVLNNPEVITAYLGE